jgi:hypothetical protein
LIIPRQEGAISRLEKLRDDAAIPDFSGDLFKARLTKENPTLLFLDDRHGGELSIPFHLLK